MGLDERILLARVERGAQYFIALSRAFQSSWRQVREGIERDNELRSATELLPLLHPEWLNSLAQREAAQGRRAFPGTPARSARCQSSLLWGYSCPFDAPLEVDHLFPYTLGGPSTSHGNSLVLCREHNRMKAHDIHVLPWEVDALWAWIPGQVQWVATILG
jgi:hypothetical protein